MIAGVIGGLVGLLVLVLFLVFILWYQICRGSDDEEDDGRDKPFDFSKKRVESVNIAAVSPPPPETEKSDFKTDGASSGSRTASRPSEETIL